MSNLTPDQMSVLTTMTVDYMQKCYYYWKKVKEDDSKVYWKNEAQTAHDMFFQLRGHTGSAINFGGMDTGVNTIKAILSDIE